jgi:hypothetical protein
MRPPMFWQLDQLNSCVGGFALALLVALFTNPEFWRRPRLAPIQALINETEMNLRLPGFHKSLPPTCSLRILATSAMPWAFCCAL